MSSEVRTVRDPFPPFRNKLSAAKGKKSTDSSAEAIKVIESSIGTVKTALRAARKWEESVVDGFAELTRKTDDYLRDLSESTRNTVDSDGGEIVAALETLPSCNGSFKSEESEPDFLSTVKGQRLVKHLTDRAQAMASEVPKKFPSFPASSNFSLSFQTRRTGDTAHEEELKKTAKEMTAVDPGGELIFQASYGDLEHQLKKCLLCFAVFPENKVIKKHDMIYWWIGEGLVVPINGQTAEQVGEDCFKLLILSGLIEPIHERDSKSSKYCIIYPWVRKMLVRKAKESAFFSFDKDDRATINSGKCRRACLAATGERKSVAISVKEYPEQLLSIFNLTAQYLSCNEEELRKMVKITSLQLGRWQNSGTHHIEVADTKFLNGLKFLKELRYLSLQGISRITELPDSIGKLSKLLILDLRSCHNLEHLPSAITSLKALTHLDASECFLLDKMPQGIGSMSNLEVLKGFVIGSATSKDRCRVSELAQLKKLWKLSIHIGSEAQIEEDFDELRKIEKLQSLMVTWGRAKSARKLSKVESTDGKPTSSKTMERKSSLPKIDEGSSSPSESIKQKAPLLNEVTTEQNASSTPRSLERPRKPTSSKTMERKSSLPKIDEGRSSPSESIKQKAPLLNEVTTEQNASSTPRSLERLKGSFNKRLGRKGSSKRPTKASAFSHAGLEKLSLQCVPDDDSVSWLLPNAFPKLKRLYIVGGNLNQFSLVNEGEQWNVEILHLKFLKNWNMEWHVLESGLKKLQIVEIFECPKINSPLIGFDEKGVWVRSAEQASSSSMAGTSAAGTRASVRNAEETSSDSVLGTSKGVLVTNAKEPSSSSMAETSAISALIPFDNRGTWVRSEEEASSGSMAGTSAAGTRVPVRNAEETSSGSVVGTNKGVLVTNAKEPSSSSMAEASAIDALVPFDNKRTWVRSEEEASSSYMAGISTADAAGNERGMTIPEALVCTSETIVC